TSISSTFLPALRSASTRASISVGDFTGWLCTSTITSPGRKFLSAAGLSGATSLTTTPWRLPESLYLARAPSSSGASDRPSCEILDLGLGGGGANFLPGLSAGPSSSLAITIL